jgi:molybdopterin synthase sulfur carrier subunit
MKVKVKFFGHLRDLIGKKAISEVDLEENATISALLERLSFDSKTKDAMFDELQQLRSNITILINGREIRFLENLDTKLTAGDEISIFPIVVGG